MKINEDLIVGNTKYSLKDICNTLDNFDTYSINEIKTNKVWIDGKPIYRKCWLVNVTITYQYIQTNILQTFNVDKIIHMEGIAHCSDGILSEYNWANDDKMQVLVGNDNHLTVRSGSTYPKRPYTLLLTLEYTKTTD